ncbi:uncharacterized protein LOC118281312 [Spodoptera frugiperda]|uniref:Uncharacterized protein LOC118281312 n=1 Tax=Spodoptera frugiperda TaxID=7108 RepID=A0A9R0F4J8_SPOFR|nr:uncharacterized protein LOC118281312 [Spodoptera frugiperda]
MLKIAGSDVMFSQYAQDPYEEFNEMIRCERAPLRTRLGCSQAPKEKKNTSRRKDKSKHHNSTQSFVMSRHHRRGSKLIKISVIELCNDSPDSDSDSNSDNVIIQAQYVVKDAVDFIMDETESLVKKISKSLIDSDF